MNYLVNQLRNFATKDGFISKTREDVKDDFTYVDSKKHLKI